MLKKNINYKDIPFFLTKNAFTGDLNLVKDVYAIKQALKNIILTIKFEKPFNFLFGANPRKFLFDTLDDVILFECKTIIANNVANFEPRVTLREIVISQSTKNPNQIIIVVIYVITSLGIQDTVTISLERTR